MVVGLALVLELLSKNVADPIKSRSVHSYALLRPESAATTSGAGLLAFTSGLGWLCRDSLLKIAYCEEYKRPIHLKRDEDDDLKSSALSVDEVLLKAPEKTYQVTLKPLFSAFLPKAFSLTVLRALLVSVQPAMEAYFSTMQQDEDEEEENAANEAIDFKAIGMTAGRMIIQEVSVVTTRRVLERVVVQRASKRVAWKLLKDLGKSAERKAGRHLSTFDLFVGVQKTTFRGHALGPAASWLVQLVLDMYRCFYNIWHRTQKLTDDAGKNHQDDVLEVLRDEHNILVRRVVGNTLKCGASLVCASLGAGVGVLLIHPSTGQWLGGVVGEYAGFMLMSSLLDTWIVHGTFDLPDVD